MAGYRAPRSFTRNDTTDIQASNLETSLYIASLATDIIDVRAFASGDDVAIAPTKEQVITAAIQYAAAQGKSAVRVPKSMLPYDASQVTFNPAVLPIHEGQKDLTAATPRAFGAAGNSVADDYPSLAALCTWIGGQGVSGVFTVDLEMGDYRTSKPLWITKPIRIVGSRTALNNTVTLGSRLYGTMMGGPILAVQASNAAVGGLVAGITTSGGNSWGATNNNRFLTLRNYNKLLDLTGLAQLCVETYFKGGDALGSMVSSSGAYLVNDANPSAFALFNASGGPASCSMTTSNGPVASVAGGAITDNARHHVAMSYDGATMRLFVDGTLVNSRAATGTVAQSFSEDVTAGVFMLRAPEQAIQYGNPNGALDSIRISDTARYTSNFTAPTAKLSVDANTLALLNFDEQIGAFTKMQTKDGNAWAWEHDKSGPSYGVIGFELDGVLFYGNDGRCTPVHFANRGQYEWSIDHIEGRDIRCGIIAQDGYDHYLRRFFFIGGGGGNGRYGVLRGVGAAIGTTQDGWTQSFQVHFLDTGSGQVYSRIYLQQDTRTHAAMVLRPETTSSGPFILDSLLFNNEVAIDPAKYRANLLVGTTNASGGVIAARACVFEGPTSAVATPWIVGDTLNIASFENCVFRKNSSVPTEVMKAQGTFVRPTQFNNCQQIDTWVRWSNVAGTAVVGKIGKNTAIAFSATPTFDCSVRDEFEITLTGNITSSTLTNVTPGQRLTFWFKQDSTGGRTVVFPSNVKGAGTISAGANTVSQQEFEVGLDLNAYAIAPMITGM